MFGIVVMYFDFRVLFYFVLLVCIFILFVCSFISIWGFELMFMSGIRMVVLVGGWLLVVVWVWGGMIGGKLGGLSVLDILVSIEGVNVCGGILDVVLIVKVS